MTLPVVHDHGVAGAYLADGHQYFALGSLLPDAVNVQRHTAGQIAQRLLAGPLLEQLAKPQQEHDRPGSREVAAQHRNADGQCIQHLHFQLAAQQTGQSTPQIRQAAHGGVGNAQRHR